jgi:hypothetical protein
MSSVVTTVNSSAISANTISNSSIRYTPVVLQVEENAIIKVGNNFTITGMELKACMKYLKTQAMQAYPEDFI